MRIRYVMECVHAHTLCYGECSCAYVTLWSVVMRIRYVMERVHEHSLHLQNHRTSVEVIFTKYNIETCPLCQNFFRSWFEGGPG
jgi:hypothetical protein